MKVSWVTDENGVPSTVEYGKLPGKYDSSATGEHTSYRYFFYTSGKIHHVTIGPLNPATTYYYRCGGSGPEFNFRTPPATYPIEFVLAGEYRPFLGFKTPILFIDDALSFPFPFFWQHQL